MAELLALIAATAVLVLIPGPNVALIVANSLRYGTRIGIVTVLGTTCGVALQLVAVILGMAAVIETAAESLTWIRWTGVVYLIWLGIRTWRQPARDLSRVAAAPSMFWRGFSLAAINPKTLLFNAAFLPQFISSSGTAATQLALVAAVFLGVILLGDLLWALFAASAGQLVDRQQVLRQRLSGGFLVAAGIGLALSRR